jgi:hypothetical protein
MFRRRGVILLFPWIATTVWIAQIWSMTERGGRRRRERAAKRRVELGESVIGKREIMSMMWLIAGPASAPEEQRILQMSGLMWLLVITLMPTVICMLHPHLSMRRMH